MAANVESVEIGVFVHSQKGKRLLTVRDYLFQLTKTYTPKNGGGSAVLYWKCERWRDLGCPITANTDIDGKILKGPSADHCHDVSRGRVDALIVRHNLLQESARRPEAAPATLLNEFVTPAVALNLSSEQSLKQAIQRHRRAFKPKEPNTACIEITGDWTKTLDRQDWYLGETNVGEDKAYVFTTAENLRILNVREIYFYLYNFI